MRIIDKTPYLEEDGSISVINRIQGTLKNGFSWYGNLQQQARAVAFFEKQLDKKFTLIRNHTLGASQITIPLILIGPPGVYVFMVTNLSGTYRAKDDNWGKTDGDKYKEASINLIKRTRLFTKAVDAYLQKQGIELPEPITPILLALNPGLHIETVRPAVRIVMNDALSRFAVELRQSALIMVVGDVHQVSEAILNPLRKKATPPTVAPARPEAEEAFPAYEPYGETQAPAENNTFSDLGFAFDDADETSAEEGMAPAVPALQPARPRTTGQKTRRKSAKTGLFGMTNKQLIIIAAMAGFIALMLIVIIIIALISL